MSTEGSPLVLVGRVVRPHGLGGAVVVEPITDRPSQRFSPGSTVMSADGDRLTVSRFEATERAPIVTFEEVSGRDQAETLRGAYLYIEEGARRQLEDEEYWPEDLTGLAVVDADGRRVGVVAGVELGAGQDRLIVETGDTRVSVPFVPAIVVAVDLEGGQVTVDLPLDLID